MQQGDEARRRARRTLVRVLKPSCALLTPLPYTEELCKWYSIALAKKRPTTSSCRAPTPSS